MDITYLDSDMRFQMSGAVWNPETESLWVVTDNQNLWQLSCPGHCDLAAAWQVENKWSLADDTEAITQADWAEDTVFIGVEPSGTRPWIREYNVAGPLGGPVVPTNEWELLEMQNNPSSGLEALTFVPDDWLTAAGFPGRTFGTGGLFFAGQQADGHIFV
ncbi:MAG: esterase-like activity of phytase family protein, partial [Actinomycetia bacterium]|nr:esterase-like activity of phytase family protein [Actinomycetes bacterium]